MTDTMTTATIKPYLLPAAVLAVFSVAYFPAFAQLAEKWSASDDYAHAFFTVPIIGYMVWQQREALAGQRGRPLAGGVLLVGSIALYLFSLQVQVPTITFLATVATLLAAFVFIAGFQMLVRLAIPIALLLMIIPIPNQLLSMVTASLQLRVSEISELVIGLFSVPLFREGNVLQIPEKSFQVVEACSGIRSLISMTTLSLIIGHFLLERRISIVLLLLCSVPVAIFINIVRVVGLVLAYHFLRFDLSVGTPHTVFGMVLFLLGLLMLFSLQRILEWWETRKTGNSSS